MVLFFPLFVIPILATGFFPDFDNSTSAPSKNAILDSLGCAPLPNFEAEAMALLTEWNADRARCLWLSSIRSLKPGSLASQLLLKSLEMGDLHLLNDTIDYGEPWLVTLVGQMFLKKYKLSLHQHLPADLVAAVGELQPADFDRYPALVEDLLRLLTKYPRGSLSFDFSNGVAVFHPVRVHKAALLCHLQLGNIVHVIREFSNIIGDRLLYTQVLLDVCAARGIKPEEHLFLSPVKSFITVIRCNSAHNNNILNAAYNFVANQATSGLISHASIFTFLKTVLPHNPHWNASHVSLNIWIGYLKYYPEDIDIIPPFHQFPDLMRIGRGVREVLDLLHLRSFALLLHHKYPTKHSEITAWVKSIATGRELQEMGYLPMNAMSAHQQ